MCNVCRGDIVAAGGSRPQPHHGAIQAEPQPACKAGRRPAGLAVLLGMLLLLLGMLRWPGLLHSACPPGSAPLLHSSCHLASPAGCIRRRRRGWRGRGLLCAPTPQKLDGSRWQPLQRLFPRLCQLVGGHCRQQLPVLSINAGRLIKRRWQHSRQLGWLLRRASREAALALPPQRKLGQLAVGGLWKGAATRASNGCNRRRRRRWRRDLPLLDLAHNMLHSCLQRCHQARRSLSSRPCMLMVP